MTARSDRPRKVQQSFYCTDSQWEEIRERSAADGRKASAWLVDRSISIRPAPVDQDGGPGLTAEQEHQLLRDVRSMAAALDELERPPEGGAIAMRPMLLGIFRMLETMMAEKGKLDQLRGIHREIECRVD